MLEENIDFFRYEDNFSKFKNVESILVYNSSKINEPFITIAIPTYKRPDTLKEALDSALNQHHYDNYEIIVLDNDDNFEQESETEKLIKSYKTDKLKYYKNEKNIGMFGNWNRCFELANSKWVALLHDDDIIFDNYLEEVCKILLKYKNFGLLSISHKLISSSSDVNYKEIHLSNKLRKLKNFDYQLWHPISNVASLYNKNNVLEIGGFNSDLFPISDYVINYNIHKKYGSYKLLKPLGLYRIEGNESSKKETAIKSCEYSKDFKNLINTNYFTKFYNKLQYNNQRNAIYGKKNYFLIFIPAIISRLFMIMLYGNIKLRKNK